MRHCTAFGEEHENGSQTGFSECPGTKIHCGNRRRLCCCDRDTQSRARRLGGDPQIGACVTPTGARFLCIVLFVATGKTFTWRNFSYNFRKETCTLPRYMLSPSVPCETSSWPHLLPLARTNPSSFHTLNSSLALHLRSALDLRFAPR